MNILGKLNSCWGLLVPCYKKKAGILRLISLWLYVLIQKIFVRVYIVLTNFTIVGWEGLLFEKYALSLALLAYFGNFLVLKVDSNFNLTPSW